MYILTNSVSRHICTCGHIHTINHTRIHTKIHTYTHSKKNKQNTQKNVDIYILMFVKTYILTYIRKSVQLTYVNTNAYTCTNTYLNMSVHCYEKKYEIRS